MALQYYIYLAPRSHVRGWDEPACDSFNIVRRAANLSGIKQADSLTEEQVSEFKEAFSLFVSRFKAFFLFISMADSVSRSG